MLSLEDCQPLAGDTFERSDWEPSDDNVVCNFTLTEVNALKGRKLDGTPAFSLVFEGPRAPAWEQGLHALHHPRLGRLEVFLVPIACSDTTTRYEAIFH